MDNDTVKEFKTIDTIYLVLLSMITFGIYFSYWYFKFAEAIKNTKNDMPIIISCYILSIFIILDNTNSIVSIFNETGFLNEKNIIVILCYLLYPITYIFFILRSRIHLNKIFEFDKQSKNFFKVIWTLIFGPLYINFNINKIKGTEK